MKHLIIATLFTSFLAAPAMAQNVSAELFGGYTFETELDLNGNMFDVDADEIFGIRGLHNLTPEIAVGLQYTRSTADFSTLADRFQDVDAIMVIARYSAPVTDMVEVYGTLGLGSMHIDYTQLVGDEESTNVTGASAAIGAVYSVSDSIGIFAELYHQAALEDYELVGDTLEYRATSVNLGVRFRF